MKIEYSKYGVANGTEGEFLNPSLLFFCLFLSVTSLVLFQIGDVRLIEYYFFFLVATVSYFLSISSTESWRKITFSPSIAEIKHVFQIFDLRKSVNWEEVTPVEENSWV